MIKRYLPWTVRIIICLLFLVSGITKMFPLWAFEKQLVDLGVADWCIAPYLARFIIAVEMALGVAILLPHYTKRLVIPATILLLVAFCIHLSIQMVQYGPMNGNCGCFGQLIPMTPLEAFIKNIITIGLLLYLFFNIKEKDPAAQKFIYLFSLFLAALSLMFVLFPFCPCAKEKKPVANTEIVDSLFTDRHELLVVKEDSVPKVKVLKDSPITKKVKADTIKAVVNEPKSTTSKFAGHTTFTGGNVNPDKGKKIVCMFAAGCDHCRATAKTLCDMSHKAGFPEICILFMDEEAELIPEFFKAAGCNFPYKVLDIPQFWQLLGNGATTPGVFGLWNGNILKTYEGIDKNQFDAEGLKKALELK